MQGQLNMNKKKYYEEAVDKYADTVYKVALSQLKNPEDAQDIFQDVFVKLVRSEKIIKDEEHLKAWLIRVTINACKDFFKNRYNMYKQELVVDIPVEAETPGDVYYAVQKLDVKYRTIIHLFYYEQYSIREISELLDINESTVKTRLARGREKIKNQMEGEGLC